MRTLGEKKMVVIKSGLKRNGDALVFVGQQSARTVSDFVYVDLTVTIMFAECPVFLFVHVSIISGF